LTYCINLLSSTTFYFTEQLRQLQTLLLDQKTSIIFRNIYLSGKQNSQNRVEHPKSTEGLERKARFKVGDHVRIYRYKKHFEKGYQTNWTTEIFRVTEVLRTNPITYKIEDLNGEEIVGSFYKEELLLSYTK